MSTGTGSTIWTRVRRISEALSELAQAVRPGGLLAIDLMTEAYCDRPDLGQIHAKVQDDWVIVTRFLAPRAIPVRPGDHSLSACRRHLASERRVPPRRGLRRMTRRRAYYGTTGSTPACALHSALKGFPAGSWCLSPREPKRLGNRAVLHSQGDGARRLY